MIPDQNNSKILIFTYQIIGISHAYQLPTETMKIQLHHLADTRGYNLILLAAEAGDTETVKVLLDYGINTELSHRGINVQILSYNNRHFEVLDMLLKENLAYPQSIDISQCSDEIKKFYESSKDLHDAIVAGNLKNSVILVILNPKNRYFYNLKNESALKTALVHKQLKIYETLAKYGVCLAPDEDVLKITENYTKTETNNLKNIHGSDLSDHHINIIIGNTSIYQEDLKTREGFKPIQTAYKALNENIFIKVILMVVAASKNFRIIFDFSRESIQVIDPYLSSKSNGFSYMTGKIFIGALKLRYKTQKNETFGTLAHEFCHYALNLIYNNDAKPYFKHDHLTIQEFDKINQECKNRYGEEEVIDLVYDCYPEDMHHAELIVRVPQLFMLYKNSPEKLTETQEKFTKLFEFFETRVVPAMRKALPGIEAEANEKIDIDEVTVRHYPKKWSIYVLFGLIVAVLIAICGFLMLKGRLLINHPDCKFEELTEYRKMAVMNGPVIYKDVKLKLMDLFPFGSAGYEALSSDQIEDVLEGKLLNLTGPEFSLLESHITHNWTTLSAPLKLKILSTNFTFQEASLKFQEIHDLFPVAFSALTSNQILDILDAKNLKIGKMIQKFTGYHPYRSLVSENSYLLYYKYQIESNKMQKFEEFFKDHKNENFEYFTAIYDELAKKLGPKISLDSFIRQNMTSKIYNEVITHINKFQIVHNLDKTKIFILASDDEVEKLLKMRKLAHMVKEQYPTRWLAFVDMDKAVGSYNDEADENWNKRLILELMGRSNVTGFEQKIFDECFKSGNLIVLWNDFNHLSPDFNKIFLSFMMEIHQLGNIQLISTKTSYSRTLRDKFHIEVHRFQPLTAREAEFGGNFGSLYNFRRFAIKDRD